MPARQKPLKIDPKKKTARVTFTADPELLLWAREQARLEKRPFANWFAFQLEKLRKAEERGLTGGDSPAVSGREQPVPPLPEANSENTRRPRRGAGGAAQEDKPSHRNGRK